MKVVAISDQHGLLKTDIPKCDLLIVAGDLCPDGIKTPEGTLWAKDYPPIQLEWFKHFWLPWRDRQPVKECYVTWGNHDFCGEHLTNELADIGVNKWTHYAADGKITHVVVDDLVTINGKKIWFSPWTKQFMNWAFMEEEDALRRRFAKIPAGLDLLVTHDPPYGLGDRCADWTTGEMIHVGSKAMRETVERVRPKVVVCGHIHEAYGVYNLGDTTIYNCALAQGRATTSTLMVGDRIPMEFIL